jgi:SAM-dependent methyltransferase
MNDIPHVSKTIRRDSVSAFWSSRKQNTSNIEAHSNESIKSSDSVNLLSVQLSLDQARITNNQLTEVHKQQLADLSSKSQQLMDMQSQKHEQLTNGLKSQIDEQSQIINCLKADLQSMERLLKLEQSKYDAALQLNNRFEQDVLTYQSDIRSLQEEIKKLTSKVRQISKENSVLTKDIQSFRNANLNFKMNAYNPKQKSNIASLHDSDSRSDVREQKPSNSISSNKKLLNRKSTCNSHVEVVPSILSQRCKYLQVQLNHCMKVATNAAFEKQQSDMFFSKVCLENKQLLEEIETLKQFISASAYAQRSVLNAQTSSSASSDFKVRVHGISDDEDDEDMIHDDSSKYHSQKNLNLLNSGSRIMKNEMIEDNVQSADALSQSVLGTSNTLVHVENVSGKGSYAHPSKAKITKQNEHKQEHENADEVSSYAKLHKHEAAHLVNGSISATIDAISDNNQKPETSLIAIQLTDYHDNHQKMNDFDLQKATLREMHAQSDHEKILLKSSAELIAAENDTHATQIKMSLASAKLVDISNTNKQNQNVIAHVEPKENSKQMSSQSPSWKWDNYYMEAEHSNVPPPWETPDVPFIGLQKWIEDVLGSKSSSTNSINLTKEKLSIKSACEVGCGSSYNTIYLSKRGYNTTGIDISQVAIDRVKRMYPEECQRIRFVRQDLLADISIIEENLRKDNGLSKFDFVLDLQCFHVLRTVDETKAAHMIKRLMNPNAFCMIVTGAKLDGEESNGSSDKGPPKLTRTELLMPFVKQGLSLVSITKSRFNNTHYYQEWFQDGPPNCFIAVLQNKVKVN